MHVCTPSFQTKTSLTTLCCLVVLTAAGWAADIHVYFPAPIQPAIDSASSGDRVLVHGGTYAITSGQFAGLHGLVIANKDIELIAIPDDSPVVLQATPNFKGAVVYVQDATATVEGFTVDGAGNQLAGSSDARPYGIYLKNAQGKILNNTVVHIKTPGCLGCQGGVGIYVRDFAGDGTTISKTDVTVMNNLVDDYQKGGIVANGEEVSVRIHNNTVTGWGQTPSIAQNGIQLGWGATGSVVKNTVTGNWYTGGYWTSTGILVYGGNNCRVVNNKVLDDQTGIYLVAGQNNKMVNNFISGSYPGWAFFDAADDSKVHANKIEP